MRFISPVFLLLFLFSFFESPAQVMKLDFDSVYVICKYKDLKKRIKKDNNKENAQFHCRQQEKTACWQVFEENGRESCADSRRYYRCRTGTAVRATKTHIIL